MAEPEKRDEAIPQAIAGYLVEGVIGRGGMGVVYRARPRGGGAPVALKCVRSSVVTSLHEVQRFEREAKIRIEHPNVVRVLDAGVEGETPWVAFELLEGESLAERLSREPLSIHEIVALGVAVADGLSASHAAGIIHRDVKPSNIWLGSDRRVKIIDFGVAHLGDAGTRLTKTGTVVGTPTYLSPEQAQGASDVVAGSDLWSLGVVLYECLTGRLPFERASPLATVLAVLIEPAPPIGMVAPDVPEELAAIVHRCLEKRPSDRFASAAELADALRTIRVSGGPTAVPRVPVATSETSPSVPVPAISGTPVSIAPGEQRVVAVLLADGIVERSKLTEAIVDRGGVLLSVFGGRAIGLFGGERWEGDEIERAVAAGLAVRRAAARVAVTSGRATYSGTTGIAGAALATAEAGCRLELEGIAVDAATAKLVADRYEIRSATAAIHELLGPREGAKPIVREMLGRVEERNALVSALSSLRSGEPRVVLATGPAGIGKTRLRQELFALIEVAARSGARSTKPTDGEWGPGELHSLGRAGAAPSEAAARPEVLAARAEPTRRNTAFALFESLVRGRLRVGSDAGDWPPYDPADRDNRALAGLVERAAKRPGLAEGERWGVAPQRIAFAEDSALEGLSGKAECIAAFRELLRGRAEGLASQSIKFDPIAARDRILLALEDWVLGLAARGPLVVAVEDLQWADEASLELLEDLAGQWREMPVLLFATFRPELLEARPSFLSHADPRTLRLRGLDVEAVSTIVTSILGRALAPEQISDLADRTGGNPLFVEQIAQAMKEDPGASLPLTVEAAVQSRLDHLPAPEKELCKKAAVFERTFVSSDLEALGVFDAAALLASAAKREILVARRARARAEREYAFRSALVREVAYRMTSPALLRDLHRQVAERLAAQRGGASLAPQSGADREWSPGESHAAERRGAEPPREDYGAEPEEIARHFERAGADRNAALWYTNAIERAMFRGDAPSVLRFAETAERLGIPADRAFAVSMATSDALEALGRLEEQKTALDRAVGQAKNDLERARAFTDLGVWLWRAGSADEGAARIDEAVALARVAGERRALAMALGRKGALSVYRSRLDEADAALREAQEAGSDLLELAPLLFTWTAQLASARGDLGARRVAYTEAVRAYREIGDVRRAAGAEMNLADVHNRLGDYAGAERSLREALVQCKRLGNRLMEGYALANLGYALTALGRSDEALRVFEEGKTLATAIGESRLNVSIELYRARCLAESDPEQAIVIAERAIADAKALGYESIVAMASIVASRAELACGRAERALGLSEGAMAIRDRLGSIEEDEADFFVVHALALEALGRTDEARATRARGLARVSELAACIEDAALRDRFATGIAAHRDLARPDV